MQRCADRTAQFMACPNVVAMMDGDKLGSLAPDDSVLQNRDYNGYTKDVNRNIVLVWDPFGKIVDAVVNAPGNFHDSKAARYGGIYDHIIAVPAPFKCVCDDAFWTQGELQDKLIKTKEEYREGEERGDYDMTLTHLRQCSEWGNQTLTGSFCFLKDKLPTDNHKRGMIIWCCILLCNFRTETVGINQIRTYFNYLAEEEKEEEEEETAYDTPATIQPEGS